MRAMSFVNNLESPQYSSAGKSASPFVNQSSKNLGSYTVLCMSCKFRANFWIGVYPNKGFPDLAKLVPPLTLNIWFMYGLQNFIQICSRKSLQGSAQLVDT